MTHNKKMAKNRFLGRADYYNNARPGYSAEILHILDSLKLNENSTVADIGAGTGIFSKMLLEKGYIVYSIEPNEHMFMKAQNELRKYPKSITINSCAEHTNLPDKSIELITAAQSYHWFSPTQFKEECLRILKENGKILLTWNKLNEKSPLIKSIKKSMKQFNNDFHSFNGGIDTEAIYYCIPNAQKSVYSHNLQYDKQTFRDRWLSSSFSPLQTDKDYFLFVQQIDSIFEDYSHDSLVTIENNTEVYIGTPFA